MKKLLLLIPIFALSACSFSLFNSESSSISTPSSHITSSSEPSSLPLSSSEIIISSEESSVVSSSLLESSEQLSSEQLSSEDLSSEESSIEISSVEPSIIEESSEELSSEEPSSEEISSVEPSSEELSSEELSSEEPVSEEEIDEPSDAELVVGEQVYGYVENGEKDGFYNVTFYADNPCSINNLATIEYVFDEEVSDKESFALDKASELHFGNNIIELGLLPLDFVDAYPHLYFSSQMRAIDYLHLTINSETYLDYSERGEYTIISLHFLGHCPTMDEGAIYINGFTHMNIYHKTKATGFDDKFMQNSTVLVEGKDKYLPSYTIDEYVLKSNESARKMALELYQSAVDNNAEQFLLMPFSDLSFFFDLKDFTLDLVASCETESAKCETIANWIMDNLTYDLAYEAASVEQVFRDRRAVCLGYSFLFHDMLAAVGIPSFYVSGAPLASLPSDSLETFVRSAYDVSAYIGEAHGWDYVILDDEVICCDLTWKDYDISDVDLSKDRVVLNVDNVRVLDDIDLISYFKDPCVVYYKSNFYHIQRGLKVNIAYSFTLNGFFNITYKRFDDSKKVSSGYTFYSDVDIHYGAIYHDGVLIEDTEDLSAWYYCMSDGRAIKLSDLVKYIVNEETNYGTVFTNEVKIDGYKIVDGSVYKVLSDESLELVGSLID